VIVRRACFAIGVVVAAAGLAACQPADRDGPAEESAIVAETPPAGAFVAEYTARDYAFVGPAELPSGWVTIRMVNEGLEHHFVSLTLLPEGKTIEHYFTDVGVPFDQAWEALCSGTVDKAGAGAMLGELLPEWYASAVSMGGPGLVAPGRVGQATMRLAPGDYVMECYVKTAEGEFHVNLGMAIPITVTDEDSGAGEPDADLEITLTNYEMAIRGTPVAGEQTVAVHFQEHPEYGLGNDVHVVRLEDDTDLDEVIAWMDWMNIEGLRAPSPAEFVGGTQEMPIGYTAFFTVDLEPGRYAWIAESGAALGMVEEFAVE
jgi:hypothetical protein